MASFFDDDKSRASSDNDDDEEMEELGGGEADAAQDNQEPDNEEDNGEGSEDEQDETQDMDDSPNDRARRHKLAAHGDPRSPHTPQQTTVFDSSPFRPGLRPEAVTAGSYDIVPTIAAPHSTSINTITATPDMRWVFTGGSDGWIRKFNWIDTANEKLMLTIAQRHPFVDSVQKAGVLTAYWENEETRDKRTGISYSDDGPVLSPVYSLAVQHQSLWLLSGTESGAINLQAVRHDEGKRITSLYKHTSAVSVMQLSRDEQSLLSGSWDRTLHDWDLNTGQVKRSFIGSGGQISALEMRPVSDLPVPRDFAEPQQLSLTLRSDGADEPKHRGGLSNGNTNGSVGVNGEDRRDSDGGIGSPSNASMFGTGNVDSLFGENENETGNGLGEDDDNEFTRAFADGVAQQPGTEGVDDLHGEDKDDADDSGLFEVGGDAPDEENAEANDEPQDPDEDSGHDDSRMIEFDATFFDIHEEAPAVQEPLAEASSAELTASESIFLDAAIDGTIRIWDRRDPSPVARVVPPRGTPPWCMHACWSADGNYIYAGRRNGTVDEYSFHNGLREPTRSLHFPSGSGPVSAVRAMPNGRHLICASYDILRLYDLKHDENAKKSTVPFLIVPGHRTGVISHLYLDPTCTFVMSTGGNRGWEGSSTEVLLGYEIGIGK